MPPGEVCRMVCDTLGVAAHSCCVVTASSCAAAAAVGCWQVSHLHGDLLVLAAGQARQMGRMINVCPDALLDDGLLDFTVLFGSPGRTVGPVLPALCNSHTS